MDLDYSSPESCFLSQYLDFYFQFGIGDRSREANQVSALRHPIREEDSLLYLPLHCALHAYRHRTSF